MKIVYLIQHTCNAGGMERVLCNKVNWLIEQGYQVDIVTTDQKGRKPFFDFASQITHYDLGIDYENNNGRRFLYKTLSYILKQLQHRNKLEHLLKTLNADVVVSMFGSEVGFLWKIKDGSAKVMEIHFSRFFRRQRDRRGLLGMSDRWRSKQDEKSILQYDKFVVLTNEDREYWGAYPNIEVIHNASTFAPSSQAVLDNKRVISVGRLTHQKGYDMLIEAWALVNAQHPDWSLRIIGGGEELGQRKEQIERLGLGDTVELAPPTSTVEKEYLEGSIYALSSRYEGLPMVMLEAMACGVPCVSFLCKCGPKDAITNDVNGVLIEEGDIEGFANGICKLIENPEIRKEMGAHAAVSVRKNFDQEKIMGQWVALFNVIIKNRN